VLKHIPVLMVTEDTNLENIVDAVKAGLNAYVIKPVDVTSFSVQMKNIF
jgi:two-component system chemotaxis response regulator CheY